MANRKNNKRIPKRPGGSRYAALAILAVIILAIVGYQLIKPGRSVSPLVPYRDHATTLTPLQTKPPAPVVHNYSALVKTHPAAKQYPKTKVVPDDSSSGDKPSGGSGRLAIIVDDMGSNLQEARALAGIGVPLTFSIIPGLSRYREVAAFAASNGIETMIHIPMQSKGWPERRLEANGLLVSMSDTTVTERLEEFMRTLPGAVGANNHMGSEYTEHEDRMRTVLTVLKGKGLFFVDSVTSPRSVGLKLARELDMKSARRNVFLDNEQDGAYILGQLNQAIRQAKKTGGVIAICHPHRATIRTLEAALPSLSKQGITLVQASQLVK